MRRISHGTTTPPSDKTRAQVLEELGEVANEYYFPEAAQPAVNQPFTYWFKDLAHNKKCLIPETDKTLEHLSALGEAMRDTEFDPEGNSTIPAAYTYFAQFVNHDINFTDVKKAPNQTDFQLLGDNTLEPWTDEMISEKVSNKRGGMLELDCLYGVMQADVLPPRQKDNHDKMALGKVSPHAGLPKGKDQFNDLVRGPKSEDLKTDRTALIGDRRNDTNIMLSQLHVAFLKAHNAIIDRERCTFTEAKKILQKYYHWLILHDFLPTIVTDETIEAVLNSPRYDASKGLPFEFSVGAFRFGHSMVRKKYYYNESIGEETLKRLFTPIVLCNGFAPTPGKGPSNIKENQIIRWRNFITDSAVNRARKFRTLMVEPIFELFDDIHPVNIPGERSLAVQDLKRGYLMRIPTGQVIAEQLKVKHPLTAADLEAASTPRQFQILKDGEMLECTPLSFYVLAEAFLADNGKLGEVGGRLVAEVVIGLLRARKDSIVDADWKPDKDFGLKKGTFYLSDLLRLAGVLEDS
jgi:hypothetical protein